MDAIALALGLKEGQMTACFQGKECVDWILGLQACDEADSVSVSSRQEAESVAAQLLEHKHFLRLVDPLDFKFADDYVYW